MPGARDVRAGGAFVEILANDAALRKGLDNASKTLKKWGDGVNAIGKTFLKIGTAALAPLIASSKVFSSMGDELAKAATRTGVTVEALSALKYAAEQSGTDFEGLENGLRKMSRTIVDAAKGSDEARETLRLLGLTVKDLNGLKPDEQFRAIAESLSRVQDPTLKAALAMQVFGKSGTQLIPLMAEGAKGIDELTDQAKRLGLVWSTEDAKAAEEFGDRLDDLWKVLKRTAAVVGGAVAPVLREMAVFVTTNTVRIGKWIDAHREVVRIAVRVAGALVVAGGAFLVLGTSIKAIGSVVGGVSSALGVLGSALSIVGTVLSTVLFSGIGLVIAGLAGLAGYLFYNSEAGQKALGALSGYFGDLKASATAALGGIVDALKSGDYALAAKILWLGIQTAFAQGISPLKVAWIEFKKFFLEAAYGAFYGAQAAWEIVQHSLTDAWIDTVATAKTVWADFAAGVATVWEKTQSFLEKAWLKFFEKTGQLSKQQLQDALSLADTQSQLNQKKIADDRDAAKAKAKADQDAAHAIEAKQNASNLGAIGKDANDAITSAQGEADKAVSENSAKIEALRKELGASRAKAAAGASAGAGASGGAFKPLPTPGDIAGTLEDVARKTVGVAGTFNSAALSALGGNSTVNRIAKATEETAKNTRGGRYGRQPAFS